MRDLQDKTEVYRFKAWVVIVVPLAALSLQAYLPLWVRGAAYLDLALLATIYFACNRRNQIVGLTLGAVIGLAQDCLGAGPNGIFGIVQTVIGYSASSLGARIDVENPLTRLILIFGFYYVHWSIFYILETVLLEKPMPAPTWNGLAVALLNAFVGVLLFHLLDLLRERE